jgi:hypothetical protein
MVLHWSTVICTGVLSVFLTAQPGQTDDDDWFSAAKYLADCANSDNVKRCEFYQSRWTKTTKQGLPRHAFGQMFLASCLSSGCYCAISKNPEFACAWAWVAYFNACHDAAIVSRKSQICGKVGIDEPGIHALFLHRAIHGCSGSVPRKYRMTCTTRYF